MNELLVYVDVVVEQKVMLRFLVVIIMYCWHHFVCTQSLH
jgi:hypothetical protein